MNQALIVGNQVLLIFIFIIIGMICVKAKILTKEGGATLSKLSLIVVTPAVIINSFQRELEPALLKNLILVFLLAVVTHTVSILVGRLLIKKRPDNRYRIERFGVAFANSGYMAIPLVKAVIGDLGVYYLSVFISVFNIFTWTIGLSILNKENKVNVKKALLNPGVVGLSIGLLFHLLRIQLPGVLGTAVSSLADLNTPLSMMTAGIFLAGLNVKKLVTNGRLYYTSFLKLMVVPLVMIGILWITQVTKLVSGGEAVAMTIVLACACPTAGATVQFSTQYNPEHSEYGAELVAMTTLLSLITLPIMGMLVEKIFW